jgi:hypothetical protein
VATPICPPNAEPDGQPRLPALTGATGAFAEPHRLRACSIFLAQHLRSALAVASEATGLA